MRGNTYLCYRRPRLQGGVGGAGRTTRRHGLCSCSGGCSCRTGIARASCSLGRYGSEEPGGGGTTSRYEERPSDRLGPGQAANGAGVAMWSMRCAVAGKVGARQTGSTRKIEGTIHCSIACYYNQCNQPPDCKHNGYAIAVIFSFFRLCGLAW